MCKFRQFCRLEPGYGKGKGDQILIDRFTVLQTAASTTGIAEDKMIPESNIIIQQVPCKVVEWGIGVPYTAKLATLAEFDPQNLITRALRDSEAETLDIAAATQFRATQVYATPTGTSISPSITFATGGVATTAATRNVMGFDIEEIVNYLRSTLKAPPYDGQNYICIQPPEFYKTLVRDPDIRADFRYGDPERMFIGELGKWCRTRFIEENNTLSATLGTTAYNAEAIIFGEDPVAEAVALPAEVRSKVPTDYGRSQGVAWYALLGFQIVWNTSAARECKIIRLTST